VAWLKEIGTAGFAAFPPKLRLDGGTRPGRSDGLEALGFLCALLLIWNRYHDLKTPYQ
jgi:hypothetical protein